MLSDQRWDLTLESSNLIDLSLDTTAGSTVVRINRTEEKDRYSIRNTKKEIEERAVAEWLHCALVMSSTLQPLNEYSAVLLRSKSPSHSVLLKAFLYCVLVGQFLHFKSKVHGDKGCSHSHRMEGGGPGVCVNTTRWTKQS